jgi:DNA replication and repair protein RecF
LPLSEVRIAAFRCLTHVEIALDPNRNYLFGPNGAGKTSVLESIYLLGRGRSFRTRQIRKLVRVGTDGFSVFGEVEIAERVVRVGVAFDVGRLQKKIDGDATVGTAELAAVLPVHVVEPGIHQLIEGGPGERRRFLDWGVFHVEHAYLEAWRQYRRVLGQRNAALKGASNSELQTWTAALVEAGARGPYPRGG